MTTPAAAAIRSRSGDTDAVCSVNLGAGAAAGIPVGPTFSDFGLMSDDAMRSDTQPAVLAEPKDRSEEKVRPECRRLEPLPTPKVPPADGGSSGALASLPRGVHCSGSASSCLGTRPTAFQSCSAQSCCENTGVHWDRAPSAPGCSSKGYAGRCPDCCAGRSAEGQQGCRCCSWSPGQHTQQQSNAAGCSSG